MSFSDPDSIKVILATDCGSTTTKAILFEKVGNEYRQTFRGEAPTTVEAPFEDVTRGVLNAAQEVEELSGRKILDDKGGFIKPARGKDGIDVYISTSSAGGGLQMMVAGVVRRMTAESAERAALGAGSIVMDTIASNDRRPPHQQIQRIRQLRPDMILLSGGVDGGARSHVVELAELVAAADPKPRLGAGCRLPVIYAGNKDVQEEVRRILADKTDLDLVDNLRPTLEHENLGPARDRIHDLFMEHVMQQAPGYRKLMSWTDVPIIPTPGAVGLIIQNVAERKGLNVVGVDIGGATTDVFSVFDGVFNRTVSANLGMSYSVSNVVKEAGLENVLRWVPFEIEERPLRNAIKNKMIRPTTIPQSLSDLIIEQAIAREALRLAFIQHRDFATTLSGVQQERSISDAFEQSAGGASIVSMQKLDLLVGSGGVLSHAPSRRQTALMLLDAFQPEGFTTLAVDSIFMMPHLGVLSALHPQAAAEIFEKDCMIYLGDSICPVGNAKPGKLCMHMRLERRDASVLERDFRFGELALLPLAADEEARVICRPERAFDVGAGRGRPIEKTVRGGEAGLSIDCRGRPLVLPEDYSLRVQTSAGWMRELEIYPPEKFDSVIKAFNGASGRSV